MNATVPTVSAKMKSFHVGVVPRSIDAVSCVDVRDAATRPTTTISSCSARSAVTSAAMRFQRVDREAQDVARRDVDDDRERDHQLDRARAGLAPERREVVRRRERGDRDEDQEVEEDRPARDEAPQLVERVAGEHRRAAAVLVQRGALDVGHRRQDEEQPGDEVDDRGEPERVVGDDPEREVDRARDRRVDDREDDRRAQRAPEDALLVRPRGRRRRRHLARAPLEAQPHDPGEQEQHAEDRAQRDRGRHRRRTSARAAARRSRP